MCYLSCLFLYHLSKNICSFKEAGHGHDHIDDDA